MCNVSVRNHALTGCAFLVRPRATAVLVGAGQHIGLRQQYRTALRGLIQQGVVADMARLQMRLSFRENVPVSVERRRASAPRS